MDGKALREIVGSFPGKRILVLGDIMLDEYIWGEVGRISPEAPVPVVEIRRRTYVPGGASNTAANITSLGGNALLASVIGNDPQAEELRAAIVQFGINPGGLFQDWERSTTTKTRIVAHNQQVVRVDSEVRTPLSPPVENRLLDWIEKQLPEIDSCIISDYGKGVVTPRLAEQLVRLGRRAAKPVIVDPKGTNYTKYRGASLVKPNLQEAEKVLKQEIHCEATLLEAGRRLLSELDVKALLITRGPEGMSLFRDSLPPLHIPSVAREVYDVTGAGDTATGALALALAANASLEAAAFIANQAAGIAVGKLGTTTVGFNELVKSEFSSGTGEERDSMFSMKE